MSLNRQELLIYIETPPAELSSTELLVMPTKPFKLITLFSRCQHSCTTTTWGLYCLHNNPPCWLSSGSPWWNPESDQLLSSPHVQSFKICSHYSFTLFSSRVQSKIALTCLHIVSGTAPPYLSELLHLYSPSRSFRSAWDTRIFRVPWVWLLGRDPFSISNLSSGTLFLSLSGMLRLFPL